ncbi:hypothetical protein [Vibrio sp. TBV020]|uniref:hypothetical protein n=1 Tax=Vibrio sp. TBV020 TaxID=3137398 RepID=UPI0038CDC18B
MQLDAIARKKVSEYVDERMEQVKDQLVYPNDETQTTLLRGRYLELEKLKELLDKLDKPLQQ